jgi:hypothetical protein
MNNTNLIEFNKMCLDIITPVNIASNEKLNTTDYIYDSKNQVAYFLNPLLWHKFIRKNYFLLIWILSMIRLNHEKYYING